MLTDCCRACLAHKKSLKSLFSKDTQNTSYASMLCEIANIKISLNDNISTLICLSCRRKVQDCYNFKCMVEKSDTFLSRNNLSVEASSYGDADCKHRKIVFNDIRDIKIKIECIKRESDLPENKHFEVPFTGENDYAYYKNIIIKRIGRSNPINDQITVNQFLNDIKEEIDSDDYFDAAGSDDEYVPPTSKRDKSEKIKTKHLSKGKPKKVKLKSKDSERKKPHLYIKPVVLENYRLIPTKSKKQKRTKTKAISKISAKESNICPYCGKITRSLHYHIKLHTDERQYKCKQCPKAYFTSKSLSMHELIHGERTHKCDKCPAAFFHASSLKGHALIHTDSYKAFVCDVCKKSFKVKFHLKRHSRIHNSAKKNVKCEQCNMSFYDHFGLKHHMRIHTGERPYKCEICAQPYSYKHDFNRHCFKKHGVYLKRRQVYVMNEEVLQKELALMQEVLLRAQLSNQMENVSAPLPFTAPSVAKAYQQTINALQSKQW